MDRRLAYVAGLICILCLLFILSPAFATDPDGRFANSPDHDWYQNAELTGAAQKIFPFKKCCAQSETVKTKFRVSKSAGDDEWFWLDPENQAWKRVPDFIIHWGESGPHGEAVLFKYGAELTCFFPPREGG